MAKRTVHALAVSDKRVLLRVDFNVPLSPDGGAILDDSRIRAVLPTIDYLCRQGAHVILCSHLGRPQGKPTPEASLAPIAARLAEVTGRPIDFASDCIGPQAEAGVAALAPDHLLLLENLRFHAGEEANAPAFAQALAGLAETYVDDAFGATHRPHASVVGVPRLLPAAAGLLLAKEIDYLSRALTDVQRPYVVVSGGAKVSNKVAALTHLSERIDSLLIGGGMAAAFLLAEGRAVGDSPVAEGDAERAAALLAGARQRGVAVALPSDVVVARAFTRNAECTTVPVDRIEPSWRIMDIGPQTVTAFADILSRARTVVWNGPLGVHEFPAFAGGTHAIARVLADLDATTIVGGGSTAEVVSSLSLADRMSHVSTGGGASLEFLEGRTLPGIAALPDA